MLRTLKFSAKDNENLSKELHQWRWVETQLKRNAILVLLCGAHDLSISSSWVKKLPKCLFPMLMHMVFPSIAVKEEELDEQ
jgi:hypothetical protein